MISMMFKNSLTSNGFTQFLFYIIWLHFWIKIILFTYPGCTPSRENTLISFISVAAGSQCDPLHQVVEYDIVLHTNQSYVVTEGEGTVVAVCNDFLHTVSSSFGVQLVCSSMDGDCTKLVDSVGETRLIELELTMPNDELELYIIFELNRICN